MSSLRVALRARLGVLPTALGTPAVRAGFLALAAAVAVDAAQLVSISVYLYPRHGALTVVALGVVRALAPALCVPALTARAHRMGHRRLLCALALGGALATAATTAAMVAGLPAGAVIGTAGVTSVCVATFRPVTSAVPPLLVRTPEELMACSAVAGFVDGVGALVGPLVVGGVLAVAGPVAATGATVFLLAGAALAAQRIPDRGHGEPPSRGPAGRSAAPVRIPEVRVVILLVGVQTMVRGALNTVVVAYVVDALGLADGVVGLLLAAVAAGSVAGLPVALGVIGRRRVHRTLGAGLLLWGLPLALAAPAQNLPVIVVLFAVAGIGNALVDVAHASALPRVVAPEHLGSVFGALEGGVYLGLAAGAAAGGVLLSAVSPQVALYVIGVAAPGAAALFARRLRRFDRALADLDAEVDVLRGQPMFGSLPIATLDALAKRMGRSAFGPGDVIMAEGEPGEHYLIVTDGVVLIHMADQVINVLNPGTASGEIALVHDIPRASAVAATHVRVRTLDRNSILAVLGHDPVAESVARDRLASTTRVLAAP